MGRWSLAVSAATDATSRSVAHGEAWLDRYGVLTRGSVVAEDVLGGFALAYKVLSGFEESGKAMRGYVIDGLGAAQFSTPAIIDRLRGLGFVELTIPDKPRSRNQKIRLADEGAAWLATK